MLWDYLKNNNEEKKNKINVKYVLDWDDDSIIKISWNSPNDNKSNLFNMLLSPEPYTIRIKDNH